MFHPHVTDAQKVLELGVKLPAVFADRGWVEEADSKLVHNTHKLTALKDVEHEILINMVIAQKNSTFMEETHNKSSCP